MTRFVWTYEAIAVLQQRYADTPTDQVAAQIGVTPAQVYHKVQKLGLRKSQLRGGRRDRSSRIGHRCQMVCLIAMQNQLVAARDSHLDMVGVVGSIPIAPTKFR